MPSVLEFRKSEAGGQWLSGEARCMTCGHTWVAVCPAGVVWLECPACSTNHGLLIHACAPAEGSFVWQCRCGCAVFFYTPDGAQCYGCGDLQVFP